jgi:ribosome-interacting GTPase 1
LPDFNDPVIVQQDKRTLEDFCLKIHKSLVKDFKYAYVWGSSVKYNPMKVGIDHVLNDEDIVQVFKK